MILETGQIKMNLSTFVVALVTTSTLYPLLDGS